MKSKLYLEDTKQTKRMREHSLLWMYGCSGELYKLLGLKTTHELVKKIKKGKIKLKSKLVYDRDVITLEENFISILDKYIGYVRDTYLINHNELIIILEETLKTQYSACLFYEQDYHECYDYLYPEYKKMFLENLYVNTIFYGLLDKDNNFKYLQKAHNLIKDKDLRAENDLKDIENFFIEVINNRKDNLYYIFIPYQELILNKNRDILFYVNYLDGVCKDYYENKKSSKDSH